jgi:hypothetical protein
MVPHMNYLRGQLYQILENALRELREKRSRAQIEIEKLDQIISGKESLNGAGAAPSA